MQEDEFKMYKRVQVCETHGETEFNIRPVKRSKGKYESAQCCECLRIRRNQVRLNAKQKALDYKGGKCSSCGYDKCTSALEFHHFNPSDKDAGPSTLYTASWVKLKAELDKCVLLCANCHREEHERLRQEALQII